MKTTTTTDWTKWIVIGGGVLLLGLTAVFLTSFMWRGGGLGYAGCGWDDWGMMDSWGYNPFGGLWMILGLLFPLGLLALLAGSVVWLLRQNGE